MTEISVLECDLCGEIIPKPDDYIRVNVRSDTQRAGMPKGHLFEDRHFHHRCFASVAHLLTVETPA